MNEPLEEFVTERNRYERIKLVMPRDVKHKVLERLHNDNWVVSFSGPYTDAEMFPKCDDTRWIFTARRELNEENQNEKSNAAVAR